MKEETKTMKTNPKWVCNQTSPSLNGSVRGGERSSTECFSISQCSLSRANAQQSLGSSCVPGSIQRRSSQAAPAAGEVKPQSHGISRAGRAPPGSPSPTRRPAHPRHPRVLCLVPCAGTGRLWSLCWADLAQDSIEIIILKYFLTQRRIPWGEGMWLRGEGGKHRLPPEQPHLVEGVPQMILKAPSSPIHGPVNDQEGSSPEKG